MRILIIEDYAPTSASIKQGLIADGHSVDTTADGQEGFLAAQYNNYGAIILDVMLPGMSGWEVLRRLREIGSEVQILMLTAKDSNEDIVRGLDTGADDYILKPFSMEELKARIRVFERKRFQKRSPHLEFPNGLRIDMSKRSVSLNGSPVKLTPKEYMLLHYLALHANELVTREDIYTNVHDSYSSAESNVVDVYVARLRKKLKVEGSRQIIQTMRGHGYILNSALDEA